MSDRPQEPGLTFGDPLAPGPDESPAESGAPRQERAGTAAPAREYGGGYTTPAPPGAIGPPAYAAPPMASGRYALAGWWSRVGAAIIDGLIIGAGALLILVLFGAVFSVGFFASDDAGIASVVVGLLLGSLAVAIVALLYAPLMMARTNGKTLGRMALGIRVVRANGNPMTFGWAMLREVAVKALLFGILSSLTAGLASLADVLWPLWDDENRALHDFVVDTRTVRD
jgi:uncharacterized RDD family membrane protein YckC